MIYVSKINSNIKSLRVAVEFGPKTLIVGDNGTCKTALISSIELALTGSVSDLLGRDVLSKESDISSLGDETGVHVKAEISGDNFGSASYDIGVEAGERRAKHLSSVLSDPETALPYRTVKSVLLGSPETVRKFFLSTVVKATEASILSLLPQACHPKYKLATHYTVNPAEGLTLAIETAKKKSRSLAAEKKTLESAPRASIYTGPPEAEIRGQIEDVEGQIRYLTTPDSSEAVQTCDTCKQPIRAAATSKAFPDISSQLSRLRDLNAQLSKAVAGQQAATAGRQFLDQVFALDQEKQEWDLLAKVLGETMKTLLHTGVATFVEKVNNFLPPGDSFALRLREDDKDVLKFGFMRDGVLHQALSGGEYTRLLAAMTSAITPDDGKVHVIIPDDRSMSSLTLTKTLEALSSSPHQVIVATTTQPSTIPEGWTTIWL